MFFSSKLRRGVAVILTALMGVALPLAVSRAAESDTTASRRTPGQELTPQILFDMLLAEIALARGRLDYSLPLYERLARTTKDARVARRATEIALYARRMDIAQETARIWAQADPASDDAQRVLAGSLAGEKMTNEQIAMRLAQSLANAGARLPGALLGLNRVLAPIEDKTRVRQIVERVTEPYLDLPEAHFARAHAASGGRDLDASLDELNQALALRPDWSQAVLLKAQIQQTKSAEAAVMTLAAYLEVHPDDVDVRRGYARALLSVKRYADARAAFEQVLAAEPDDHASRYAMGIIALEMGDVDAAAQAFEKLKSEGYSDHDGVETGLAQVAEARGDIEEAIAHYDAVKQPPRRERAQLRVAQLLATHGDLDGARKRLRALGHDDASRANYLLIEAQLLRDAGKVQEAVSTVDEALKLKPDDPDLLYESAMLADRLGHTEAMEGKLRKIIALDPRYAHAYNALGYWLADRGERLDEAESLIRKAVELRPKDPFIIDSLGWVRYRRGDLQEARHLLEEAYSLRADPEIAAHLGEVMWEMGDQDGARKTWQAAAKDYPDNTTLATVMRRYGQ
ncbi:tetratricopeptide repeat protein [Nitrogeniibacter mangrovi]|uniref:Tetratricopeptide repeat protein n=1 Tax=Nitrogeniibacter mangrovi TaxID=2016596 RepID=A0A6C1B594_9RHOO|nr:tetratricopeptide repeat protein [Nitrogeniibacter mangrovi]QID18886.1 tetratricopeptide repeat protein [Nitrogeniibacter mangrovi]